MKWQSSRERGACYQIVGVQMKAFPRSVDLAKEQNGFKEAFQSQRLADCCRYAWLHTRCTKCSVVWAALMICEQRQKNPHYLCFFIYFRPWNCQEQLVSWAQSFRRNIDLQSTEMYMKTADFNNLDDLFIVKKPKKKTNFKASKFLTIYLQHIDNESTTLTWTSRKLDGPKITLTFLRPSGFKPGPPTWLMKAPLLSHLEEGYLQ